MFNILCIGATMSMVGDKSGRFKSTISKIIPGIRALGHTITSEDGIVTFKMNVEITCPHCLEVYNVRLKEQDNECFKCGKNLDLF